MKLLVSLFFCTITFLFLSRSVLAQAYDATYSFDFYPQISGKVKAELNISLESLRSDVYINEFILSIPTSFFSEKLIASIDARGTDYKVESNKQGKRIIFTFDEPNSDQVQTDHTIKLSYTHDDLYTQGTYVDELILPLIRAQEGGKVNVKLHLPTNLKKDTSIIKPRASVVYKDIIEWKDVAADTLYVQFGSFNLYSVSLSYFLINPELRPVKKSITLPPDTLYQKIIIESLQPKPDQIALDEDGNYIATYQLKPREQKSIIFKGGIQVFSKARDEIVEHVRTAIQDQEKYLLSEQDVWNIGSYYAHEEIKNLKTAQDIYNYVSTQLTYDARRLDESPERRGAYDALQEQFASICTDFTDTFIALAREKGILAREIQGYGYSEKKDIRPLSLKADILHSWPEFYDKERDTWVQIDPTWAQTSGINYFQGFDTQHIALAIHGKDPNQPLPAGFQKEADKKAISIAPAKTLPKVKETISISNNIPIKLISQKSYRSNISVINTGNVFLYNLKLNVVSSEISFDNGDITIDVLAPYQKKDVEIQYKPRISENAQEHISFLYDGEEIAGKTVSVESQSSHTAQIVLGIIIALIILIGSFFVVKSRSS